MPRDLGGVSTTCVSGNRQIHLSKDSIASELVPIPLGHSQGKPGACWPRQIRTDEKEFVEIQSSQGEGTLPALSLPTHNKPRAEQPRSALFQEGKGEWQVSAQLPPTVRETHLTQQHPKYWGGISMTGAGKGSGKRQIRIPKGTEGMQFLVTVLRTLAGSPPMSPWETLTRQSFHRAHGHSQCPEC